MLTFEHSRTAVEAAGNGAFRLAAPECTLCKCEKSLNRHVSEIDLPAPSLRQGLSGSCRTPFCSRYQFQSPPLRMKHTRCPVPGDLIVSRINRLWCGTTLPRPGDGKTMRRTGAITLQMLTVTSLAVPVAIPAQQSAPNRILRPLPTTVPMPTSTATPAQTGTLSRPALLPQINTSVPRTAEPSQRDPAVQQRPPVLMRAPVRMPITQVPDMSGQKIEVPLLSFVGMRGASQSNTSQTINVPLLSFTGNRSMASTPAATQLITVPALTFVGIRGAASSDTSTLIQTPPLSFTGVRP